MGIEHLYKILNDFKIDKKFWINDNLSGEDYELRSKPAPYVKATIKIAKLLGLKNVVEIGSLRYAVTDKCLEFFYRENDAFNSPPCCGDGHSGFFFGEHGFDLYTVDIDENCKTQIEWSYNNLNREYPQNIHTIMPKDGIEFLKEFNDKIDILFIDCWDKGSADYTQKHLDAYLAAKDKLSDVHLILIDDTDYILGNENKDSVLTPYLLEQGYIPLFNGRQTLFLNTLNVTIHDTDYTFTTNTN